MSCVDIQNSQITDAMSLKPILFIDYLMMLYQ